MTSFDDYYRIMNEHMSRLHPEVTEWLSNVTIARIILKVIVSSIITFARQTYEEEDAMKSRAKSLAYEIRTARKMLSLNTSCPTMREMYEELKALGCAIPENHVKFFTMDVEELLRSLKEDYPEAIMSINYEFLSMGREFKAYVEDSSVMTSRELFVLYFYTMDEEEEEERDDMEAAEGVSEVMTEGVQAVYRSKHSTEHTAEGMTEGVTEKLKAKHTPVHPAEGMTEGLNSEHPVEHAPEHASEHPPAHTTEELTEGLKSEHTPEHPPHHQPVTTPTRMTEL